MITLSVTLATLCAAPGAFALDTGDIVITSVKGEVHVVMSGAERSVRAGALLELPATVQTGGDGAIELKQGATTVGVGPDTLLEFPALAKPGGSIDRIVQPRGNAFYSIGKREGHRLRIETPYLVGVVKGTQFNVVAQDGATTISLFEGLLEVRSSDGDGVIDLHAGEIATRSRTDPGIGVLKMNVDKPLPASPASPKAAPPAPASSPKSGDATPAPKPTRPAAASSGGDNLNAKHDSADTAASADHGPSANASPIGDLNANSHVDLGVSVGDTDNAVNVDLGLENRNGNTGQGNGGEGNSGQGNSGEGNSGHGNNGQDVTAPPAVDVNANANVDLGIGVAGKDSALNVDLGLENENGNNGQGNSGQGNSGQGNSGQGNSGQGNSGQGANAPPVVDVNANANVDLGVGASGTDSTLNVDLGLESENGDNGQGNSGQGNSGQGNSGQGNGNQGNGNQGNDVVDVKDLLDGRKPGKK